MAQHILLALQESQNKGETISALLTAAIADNEPLCTLSELRQAIVSSDLTHEVDVLSAIPQLLLCTKDGVSEFLDVLGSEGSPKEAVIALQEAVERLTFLLSAEEEDPAEEAEGDGDSGHIAILQLGRVLDLYALVLPRLPKRRKTQSEILLPLVAQIESAIRLSVNLQSPAAAGKLISSISCIISSLAAWIGDDADDRAKSKGLLLDLACTTLEACAKNIQVGLAQRVFEAQNPRFVTTQVSSSSSPPIDPVQATLDALRTLEIEAQDALRNPRIGSLILIAHADHPSLDEALFPLLRWIIASIQTNTGLDETMAILLKSLGSNRTSKTSVDVPTEFVVPLVHVLGPLAGSHPDPATRYLLYRLLSTLLSLGSHPIRLALLRELLSDSDGLSPQMQVASIGLVREALMEALSRSDEMDPNPLMLPTLLRELGPIIFHLRFPDLFMRHEVPLEDFMESSEPLRLVEVLTLLYLLLSRDTNNKSGIRDTAELNTINRNLLDPLESQLEFWNRGPESEDEEDSDHSHSVLQLGILSMWLERTRTAVKNIL